jgi:hypothetical protein
MRPLAIAACLLLAACSPGRPPEHESEAAKMARQSTQLRDAMQKPIDKAKSVDDTQQKAADAQRKAVEDAGG